MIDKDGFLWDYNTVSLAFALRSKDRNTSNDNSGVFIF